MAVVNGLPIAPYPSPVSMNAPRSASGSSMFGLLPLIGTGVQSLFGLWANRSANKANQQATAMQAKANADQLAYERELEATRQREWAAQQTQLQSQWNADQAFRKQQWDASEDERLYQRKLSEDKEARRGVNRDLVLGMIANGSTSPGLRTLGSYRG